MADFYESRHTGQVIDDAVDRAKAGGAIDTALQNKAPAGYGLGTIPKNITDWNTANVCGWYTCDSGAANSPDSNFGWFGLTYTTGNPEIFIQDVFTLANVNKYYHRRRLYYPGTGNGTPWEWVDPPLYEGVEYRTTERYQSKPVYTMMCPSVALGSAGSTAYIEGLANIKDIIDYRIQFQDASSGQTFAVNNWSKVKVAMHYDSGYAYASIACIEDCSNRKATGTFKYTKTTD